MTEFGLFAKGLERASTVNEEFEFIVGGKRFGVNRFLADFLSPKVSSMPVSDPLIQSLKLELMTIRINLSYL